MVSSSSPGISLMAEAMSYMAGSGTPMVLVNIMRAGPGLGGIGPSQSDYFQATKGHGHGDYRVPVLAPDSIGEAMELTAAAFELAERYRTPVMLVADGILGQAMEPVELRFRTPERHAFDWALTGAAGRPARIIKSIDLDPEVLEKRNLALQHKYREIARHEVRWEGWLLEDAEFAIVAYGTAARVARSAIAKAREKGIKVGLFRPITLWPFPERELMRLSQRLHGILTVELSSGQMVEDVRLAVEGRCPVAFHGRMGGMVPTPDEVLGALKALRGRTERARGESHAVAPLRAEPVHAHATYDHSETAPWVHERARREGRP
jgi:2-oxoglutarate ferredoxin oxidoreductase subunit alpha